MVRNAGKLYYPVKESILSILPIVDEFVVALGDCDADDKTLELIESIQSDKIKIIHSKWDLKSSKNGSEYARQTDIAKNACTGDWLFYLQSDEVVHEKYLPIIRQRCEQLFPDKTVEGLLFDYVHFWGDYNHHLVSHSWYSNEIRIIRNDPEIHSWRDAQSFRRIPDFDGKDYYVKKGTHKLNVAHARAAIYHYGWVRPPYYMRSKEKAASQVYSENKSFDQPVNKSFDLDFNYGDLSKLNLFKETHPESMMDMIARFNWQHLLYPNRPVNAKVKHKHEKLKNRLLSAIEQYLLGGNKIFTFKNYKFLKR